MADRKIYQKEQAIRKKITKAENDIALWKNNLEFFGRMIARSDRVYVFARHKSNRTEFFLYLTEDI